MARTAKITLDGAEYVIRAMNIGELEEATEIFTGPSHKAAYGILRIAMRRAEPKLNGSLDSIEPTFDEVNAAFRTIAELSGLKLSENPPEPVAPATS